MNGLAWKYSKDQILARGKGNKEQVFTHSNGSIAVSNNIIVLGETLTKDPNTSIPQIKQTIAAMKTAAHAYQWITWSEITPSVNTANSRL